jgi:torso-like protein
MLLTLYHLVDERGISEFQRVRTLICSNFFSGNLRLASGASKSASKIQVGDSDGLLAFVKHYGTHYIRSVEVGDAIYQVFAMSKEQMSVLKNSLGGRNQIGLREWDSVHEQFLAPWLVKETGEVLAASGDAKLQRFLTAEARTVGQFGSYPNLIEGLVKKPNLVQMLEELTMDSEAITALEFQSLRDFFPSIQVREFYDETLSTQSALWGANI